jgi:hypothetical protein
MARGNTRVLALIPKGKGDARRPQELWPVGCETWDAYVCWVSGCCAVLLSGDLVRNMVY